MVRCHRRLKSLIVVFINFLIWGITGVLVAGPVNYIDAPGGLSVIAPVPQEASSSEPEKQINPAAQVLVEEAALSEEETDKTASGVRAGHVHFPDDHPIHQQGTHPHTSTASQGISHALPSSVETTATQSISSETTQALTGSSQQALTIAGRTLAARASDYEDNRYDSTQTAVGHVAGDFAVSASGAATYHIPIALPPGTAGVQPKISLNYDSQSGDGMAGRGFNLSGLSAISRCGRTTAQDGYIRAVHLDENDAFCLDGQRLIQTGGSTSSSGGTRTYRKEIDDYSTITATFSGYQPLRFDIKTVAGDTLTYGYNAATRVAGKTTSGVWVRSGKVRSPTVSWVLARTEDRLGNYIAYHYSESVLTHKGLQHHLTRIDYTGNQSLGLAPYVNIHFDYEDRQGIRKTRYVAGAAFYEGKRLKQIRIIQQGATVREYKLGYHALHNAQVGNTSVPHLYDRLGTVTECGRSKNLYGQSTTPCLPPTYFKWDGNYLSNYRFGTPPGFTPRDSVQAKNITAAQRYDALAEFKPDLAGYPGFYGQNEVLREFGESDGFTTHDDDHLFFGDVNGDGLTDLVGLSRQNNSYYKIRVATASTDTRTNVKDHHGNLSLKGRYFRMDQFVQDSRLYVSGEGGNYPVTLADVDGDGRSDIVAFRKTNIAVMFSEGDQFSSVKTWGYYGQPDFTYNAQWRGEHLRFLADVNGDGRADLIGVGGVDVIVALSTGKRDSPLFGEPKQWSSYFGVKDGFDYASGHKEQFELADVNGDGLPDIVAFDHNGVKVALNHKGESFSSHSTWTGSITDQYFTEETPRSVGDVNGDGLADLVVFAKDGVYVSYSTGKHFSSKSKKISAFRADTPLELSSIVNSNGSRTTLWTKQKRTPRHVMDVNGDGLSDLLGFGHDGVHVALSNGTGFEPLQKWLHSDDHSFSSYVGWGGQSNNQPRYTRSFGDVNGDGLPDIIAQGRYGIYVGDNFMESLRVKQIVSGGVVSNNQAQESGNGLHRMLEIEYETLTGNQGVYRKTGSAAAGYRQFPMHVVAKHHDSNGEIIGQGGQWIRHASLSYRYENLKVDRLRGMQGFQAREVHDPQTNTTTRETYYQDFPRTGQTRTQNTKHMGTQRILSEDSSSSQYYTVSGLSNRSYYRVYTTSTQKKEYEFSNGSHFRTTDTSYSRPTACGQVETITQVTQVGAFNNNALEKEYRQKTLNEYPTWGDCFQQSRLKRTTVEHSLKAGLLNSHFLKPFIPTGHETVEKRSSSFFYHGNGQIRLEIIESNDRSTLLNEYTYDGAGNVLTKTVIGHGGKKNATQFNPDVNRTVATTTYDDQYRFAETVTNALGQEEQFEYDPRFGTVTQHTDAYGLVTETRYNAFGQKYLTSPPVGGEVLTRYSWCNATVSRQIKNEDDELDTYTSRARYCITTQNQDVARAQYTKTYYDQVDRVIRVETMGVGDGGSRRIYTDKVYDNKNGRLMGESRPYYSGTSPGQQQWITYTYDELGRTTQVAQPDGGKSSVVYNGLTTKKTNALNQTTTEVRTPRGKMAWVLDAQNDDLGRGGNQVGFIYDALGNLVKTVVVARDASHADEAVHTSDKAVVTEFGYNDRNQKIWMKDPSMGHWDYSYNALGELTWQRDAKQQETRLFYDDLGRLTLREEKDLTTRWYFNTSGDHKHRLRQVTAQKPGQAIHYRRSYDYNLWGQVKQEDEDIIGSGTQTDRYTTKRDYDAYGRLDRLTYPRIGQAKAVSVRYQYDYNYGHLFRLVDGGNYQEHWRLLKAAADGQVTQQRLGSRVTSDREYDLMGRLTSIDSLSGSTVLQSLEYDFDLAGNLKQRRDTRSAFGALEENFRYDELNRLTRTDTRYRWSAIATQTTHRVNRYDGHGNLRYQDGIRNIYGSQNRYGRHTPYQAGSQEKNGGFHGSLEYDANGNVLTHSGKQLRFYWNSFNKPWAIVRGSFVNSLQYGDKHQRIQKYGTHGVIWYTDGGHYERYQLKAAIDFPKQRPSGETNAEQHRYHLRVGGQRVGTLTQYLSSTGQWTSTQRRYYLTDHLGSTDVVVDSQGQRLHQLSYTSWGERRQDSWHPDGLMDYGRFITNISLLSLLKNLEKHAVSQGFTGHEHDDLMGLVNMKGRLYDPQLGRFMSADPHIQAPHNVQSYNRYTYVLNNPLSYTDPSGYFFKSLERSVRRFVKKYGRTIIAIAATALTYGALGGAAFATASFGNAVVAGAATGAVFGGISTGTLKGALTGAVFGALSGGLAQSIGHGALGTYAKKLGYYGKHIAHGAAQGVVSALQGGKFRSGFVGGFFGHLASGLGERIVGKGPSLGNVTARTMISATVGGAISAVTGGKFANGAVTAAFTHLFNAEGGVEANSSPGPGAYELENGNGLIQLSVNDMGALNDGSPEGFYNLNVDGTVSLLPSGSVDSVCPECYVMGVASLKYSGKFLDVFTKGYGLEFGKVAFMYQLPKTQGRMIFKYGKFRLQYGKTWGGVVQPWYKRTYLKLPGKTNHHWPWQ